MLTPFYAGEVIPNRWLLGIMGAALLAQSLTFTLKFGWAAALGLLFLSAGLGYVVAPGLRATEQGRLGAFLFHSAAVLGSMVVQNRTTETLCLVTSVVVVMLLWEDEGPRLRKRLRDEWHKTSSRFSRPVISLPS